LNPLARGAGLAFSRAVQEAALGSHWASPDLRRRELAAKLEKMTSVSFAELAVHAEEWPDV
jgi:hypothetical protein